MRYPVLPIRLTPARGAAVGAVLLLTILLIHSEQNRRQAEAIRDTTDAIAYDSQIALAQSALQAHDFRRVRDLLTQTMSYKRRGMEWDYLDAGCPQQLIPFVGHRAEILAVAFSPGGSHVATTATDKTLRLWQLARPGTFQLFRAAHQILSLDFSPDGTTLTAADDHGRVMVLDARSLQLLRDFSNAPSMERQGHPEAVRSVVHSPNGKLLAVGGEGATVRLYDAHRGTVVTEFAFPFGTVFGLAFSPQGDRLAATGNTGTLIWHVQSGKVTGSAPQLGTALRSIAFSPEGRHIVTADWEGNADVRDGHTCASIGPLVAPPGANAVSSTADPQGVLRYSSIAYYSRDQILAGTNEGTVRSWNAHTLSPIGYYPGHQGRVTALSVSANTNRFATVSGDKTVVIWGAGRPARIRTFRPRDGQHGAVISITMSPDGRQMVTQNADGTVALRATEDGRPLRTLGSSGHATAICFTSDGKQVLYHGKERILFGATHQDKTYAALSHPGITSDTPVQALAVTPDRRRLYAATWQNQVVAWSLSSNGKSGVPLADMPEHSGPVTGLCVSPDGQRLITGTGGPVPTLSVWRIGDNYLEDKYLPPYGRVTLLQASPDGRFFVAGHNDGTTTLWDMQARAEKRFRCATSGDGTPVVGMAISSDNERLAVTSEAGNLNLFDMVTGRELLRLSPQELTNRARAVAFLGSSGLLIGCQDGSLLRMGGDATETKNR
jgi:WD40 repeat protein